MIVVTINPSGAAFEEGAAREVARIMNRATGAIVSGRVHAGSEPFPLRDFNGQRVGEVVWKAEDADA